jgi:N6-L-threonylcarbamoyladenine synthase
MMRILGIETSCDETGAALVENGTKLLSNVVSSSVALHQKYGGVVPELAAREQVKVIIPVICEALDEAGATLEEIDALAVTVGHGLIGSLLVGVETAKTLALIFKKSIVPVSHLYGHLYANWIGQKEDLKFPIVSLIVSGGHTDLVLMEGHQKIKWLGGTRDDAAGEAFDKVARLLGLSYPGGPVIEKAAKTGNPEAFNFPRPMIDEDNFDFSFSGLKTAVVNLVHKIKKPLPTFDIAASFQEALVDVLVTKTVRATQKYKAKEILLGGGVAANQYLVSRFKVEGERLGIQVFSPPIELCIDNAAMIAAAAFYNPKPTPPEKIQAQPGLYFH